MGSFPYLAVGVHFCHVMLATLYLALTELPIPDIRMGGQEHDPYTRPSGATTAKYFEVLENNTHIIYPLLVVTVLVLISLGVLQAWRSQDLDGLQKAELKRELIRELRRDMHGTTVDAMSKVVGLPPFRLNKLLEEMQTEGILESRTDTRRITTWRLKGLR